MKNDHPFLSSKKTLWVIAVDFLLILALFFFFFKLVEARKDDGRLIHLAGRQRILSQKIAKDSILFYYLPQDSRTRHALELEKDTLELKQNFKILTDNIPSLEAQNLLSRAELFLAQILNGVEELLSLPLNQKKLGLAKILDKEESFLALMNETVMAYVDAGNRQIQRISTLILASIALLLALFVFNSVKALKLIRKNRDYQKTIQEKNQDLREMNQNREKLISIIAHDLRSPFTGILGFSKLLMEEKPERFTPEEQKTFLKGIHVQAEQTLNLLENLLQWAQTRSPKMEFLPEIIDLYALVQDVLAGFSAAFAVKKITARVEDSCRIQIFADSRMIQTILRNLISNALKFSYPGGEIALQAQNTAESVMISVADQGAGMSEEILNRLKKSESFYSSSGTRGEQGSGLGLDLCRELAQRHGGFLSMESRPGKGSRFWITLPKNIEGLKTPGHIE